MLLLLPGRRGESHSPREVTVSPEPPVERGSYQQIMTGALLGPSTFLPTTYGFVRVFPTTATIVDEFMKFLPGCVS